MADENIPMASEAMAAFGPVRTFHGRALSREDLGDTEILLVRSITRVDRNLLDGMPVKFVGTATIGTDHVDQEYLADQGIRFASAAGCNANSVAEYVIAGILELHTRGDIPDPAGLTLGIVGVGHVGSRLAQKARALGMNLMLNDPPRQRREGGDQWRTLEETLANSDIISLHVPLERNGADPTFHLLSRETINLLRSGAALINSARGPVVDNDALAERLRKSQEFSTILDVWETEPAFDPRLAALCAIGTPHIAGYSQDGKLEGTRLMHAAVAELFHSPPIWTPPVPEHVPARRLLTPDEMHLPISRLARTLIRERYRIDEDSARFEEIQELPDQERARGFDLLRKTYPDRWEWTHTTLVPPSSDQPQNEGRMGALQELGFRVEY